MQLGNHAQPQHLTGWVNAGALRALARQPVQGVASERPGTRFAALSVGSRGFVNRRNVGRNHSTHFGGEWVALGKERSFGLTVEPNPASAVSALDIWFACR
jgi:hypothetical protein